MKISFITTVYNEEKTIDKFIDSLLSQAKQPDEIIIVDGGSTDKTVDKIKSYGEKIILLVKKGNRSKGRNEAVKFARNEIIACSDAGCELDKRWLENIAEPFKSKQVDVVAGYYKPRVYSEFEKCLATYTCVMPDRIDPENFLPSSRSVAFRKSAWKKVGGYPEELDTCEDLVFASRMKEAGLRFEFARKAIVYWPQRKNILQAFSQFLSYAKGDGRALYFRNQTPLLFIRYLIGIYLVILFFMTGSLYLFSILVLLVLGYIAWSIKKNYRYIKSSRAFLYLPLLQFTSDAAVILGVSIGLASRFKI